MPAIKMMAGKRHLVASFGRILAGSRNPALSQIYNSATSGQILTSVRCRSRFPAASSGKRRPVRSMPPEIVETRDLVPDFDLVEGRPQPLDEQLLKAQKKHYLDLKKKEVETAKSTKAALTDDDLCYDRENAGMTSHEKFLRQCGLPKIVRIHGWDKKNKQLKLLRQIFFRKTAIALAHSDGDQRKETEEEGIEEEDPPNTPGKEKAVDDDSYVVLEGKRMISEAMSLGINPQLFITSKISQLQNFPLEKVTNKDSIRLFLVPYNTISGWSDLTTSPGFMAAFSKRDIVNHARNWAAATETTDSNYPMTSPKCSLPLTLILDNVRNPDNFGGILRVAVAAGCRQVISTSGCVDPWQPKVIRAAAGAHFRLQVQAGKRWNEMEQFLPANDRRQVVVCNMPNLKRPLSNSNELMTGDDVIGSPQQLTQLLHECQSYRCQEPGSGKKFDYSFDEAELVDKFSGIALQQTEMRDLQVEKGGSLVVMVGGETEGVSLRAHKFAVENDGQHAYLPLFNGMESLNVLSAASILLYHCQSQCIS